MNVLGFKRTRDALGMCGFLPFQPNLRDGGVIHMRIRQYATQVLPLSSDNKHRTSTGKRRFENKQIVNKPITKVLTQPVDILNSDEANQEVYLE